MAEAVCSAKEEGLKDTMPPTLQFLNYVSKLKHLDREGWIRKGIKKPESVAGHMYRMAIMSAFIIDDPNLDLNKCIRLSLVHDMGESIIGDIVPQDAVPEKEKQEIETAAIDAIASQLAESKGEEMRQLFLEYENAATPEAKLVKDLDKFDMILQAYEYEQSEGKPKFLQEFFDSTKKYFESGHVHAKVNELVQKLHAVREKGIPYSL